MPDNRFDFLELDESRPARPQPRRSPVPPIPAPAEAPAPAESAADGEWRVVELIGGPGHAAGEFYGPAGLGVDLAENLYVADTHNHRVQRISPDGVVTLFGARGQRAGQFMFPRAVSVDPEFRMFILEAGNNRVQVLDAEGESLRAFGAYGSGLAQFHGPSGLSLAPYGALLVADQGNRRVARWRRLGEPLDIVASLPGGVTFRQPYAVATDPSDRTYVLDRLLHAVLRFNPRGALEAVIGGQGAAPGQLFEPEALAVDAEGRMYVADTGNHRLQILDRDGRCLQIISGTEQLGPFNAPAGVAVSLRGTVYMADTGNHRVFRLARREAEAS